MNYLQNYISEIKDNKKKYIKKLLLCLLGNFIMGMGIALMKTVALGNDPFNGACMSTSAVLGIPYNIFTMSFNASLFIIEIIFGRKYINVGTFINSFLVCNVVSLFMPVYDVILEAVLGSLIVKIVFLAIALALIGLGMTFYQLADLGISPFDALPLMICDRFPKLKFFYVRICFDGFMTLIMLMTHGIIGIGTLATVFALGPLIHLFAKPFRNDPDLKTDI